MGKTNKQIFDIGNNKFAVGTLGKLAEYVVAKTKKGYQGVRGRRPKLDDRFKPTKGNAELREALGIE